jgi:hypothetical protein
MIISENKLNNLISTFKTENSNIISESILMLRDEEPFKGAIGLLVSLYNDTDNSDIQKIIANFLNDIKDQSVREEIVAELNRPLKPETLRMILSSCWQSGINYSDYIFQITDIFLKSDYLSALECFTIIEESVALISDENKSAIIKIIEENSSSCSSEMITLINELLSLLKNKQ